MPLTWANSQCTGKSANAKLMRRAITKSMRIVLFCKSWQEETTWRYKHKCLIFFFAPYKLTFCVGIFASCKESHATKQKMSQTRKRSRELDDTVQASPKKQKRTTSTAPGTMLPGGFWHNVPRNVWQALFELAGFDCFIKYVHCCLFNILQDTLPC